MGDPQVVYDYADKIRCQKISNVLISALFIIVLVLIFFLANKDKEISLVNQKLKHTQEDLHHTLIDLDVKDHTIKKLEHRIVELSALTDSKKDVKNYILTYYKKSPPQIAEQIADSLFKSSVKYDVPIVAALGVMEVESHFNPYVVSSKYARGLMQVMYKIWKKELNLTSKYELHDIARGTDAGVQVLRKYLDKEKNNMDKALRRYNGLGKGGDPKYVKKVYAAMGKFNIFRSFANMTVEENGNGNNNHENIKLNWPDGKDAAVVMENGKVFAIFKKDFDKKDFDDQSQNILLHKVKTPFFHTVKYRGETLYMIAKWYTGDGNNWKKLMNSNPNLNTILPFGEQIHIPDSMLINKTAMPKEYIKGEK